MLDLLFNPYLLLQFLIGCDHLIQNMFFKPENVHFSFDRENRACIDPSMLYVKHYRRNNVTYKTIS